VTTPALLDDLRRRGVEMSPDGGQIRCRAPKGTLTPELRRAIGEHKAELLLGLEAEAAGAELDRIEAALTEQNALLLALYRAEDRAAAERLRAEIRGRVEDAWLPARHRWARAEHALGRLDPDWAFLLDDPDAEAEVAGWRRVEGGWAEAPWRAERCVVHADRPLAPGDRLLCVRCQLEVDAMPGLDAGHPSLPVPPGVAPDDPRLRELATVAALAAMHPDAAGGERP
jgi:hypothetical protein